MDEKTCEHLMGRMDDRIGRNEDRLNNHSDRIKELEYHRSRSEVQMENLIEKLGSLVTTINWFMGLMVSVLLGFFIWYIQTL